MVRTVPWILALAAALATVPAFAQAPAEKWMFDRQLTISPMKLPTPALQYRLYPTVTERKAGNAAPIYLRFAHERNDAWKKALSEKPAEWLAMPIDKMPIQEIKDWLKLSAYILNQLDLGARRQTCDWNYTLEIDNLFGILLGDAQEMRWYSRLLALKARVEVATGDYPAAIRTLQTGFSFAQQLSQGPFLINSLIGVASTIPLAEVVMDLMERPDAPNLTWALVALPRPFVDLRIPFEIEGRIVEHMFPDLPDLAKAQTRDQWDAARAKWNEAFTRLGEMINNKPITGVLPEAEQLVLAKKYLIETKGRKAAEVEAMPKSQILVTYQVDQYHQIRDDHFRATYLPYLEGRLLFDAAEKQLKELPATEVVLFMRQMLPALSKIQKTQARVERQIAALRVVEALRLHAAAKGQLPDNLDDVKDVPLPNDPYTGKPFVYQREGQGAVITSRPPDEPLEAYGMRIRLTLRK